MHIMCYFLYDMAVGKMVRVSNGSSRHGGGCEMGVSGMVGVCRGGGGAGY